MAKIERIFFCLVYYNDKKSPLYNVRNLVRHQLNRIPSQKATEKVIIQSISRISERVLYCCRTDTGNLPPLWSGVLNDKHKTKTRIADEA